MKSCFFCALFMSTALLVPMQANELDTILAQEQLLGDPWRVRSELESSGVEIGAGYAAQVWTNMSGGQQTGTELLALGTAQVDLDLETIAEIKGSSFFVSGAWYSGGSPTEKLIGADLANNLSGIESTSQFLRIDQIYVQQQFGEDALCFQLGLLRADATFMASDYASLFLNAQFGTLPTIADNVNSPVYPLSGPGAWGSWSPKNSPWSVQVGVYTADAGDNTDANYGFGWRFGGDAGFIVYSELAYAYEAMQLPGKIKLAFVGANNQTTNYRTGLGSTGYYSFYWVLDQTVLTKDDGSTKVGFFSRLSYNPQSESTQQHFYTDAGFNILEPIPGRESDALGIAMGYQNYYDYFRQFSATSGQAISPQQTIVELTYSAEVTPWLTVQPDFRVFINPELIGDTAFAFGFQASIVF